MSDKPAHYQVTRQDFEEASQRLYVAANKLKDLSFPLDPLTTSYEDLNKAIKHAMRAERAARDLAIHKGRWLRAMKEYKKGYTPSEPLPIDLEGFSEAWKK